jgi:hypothetical protein
MLHPRNSSGQSNGHESNCRLCHKSSSEDMCARLNVLVSSRHNGPAFIAVSASSIAEKAVAISAAKVSIPGFAIRFNDTRLEIGRRNRRPSTIDFGISGRRAKNAKTEVAARLIPRARYMRGSPPTPCFVSHPRGALSAHWSQPRGMQTVIFIADSTNYLHASKLTFSLLLVLG